MRVYELRTYTLASREDLDFYKDVIYPRHLDSFPKHGIRPHGFWTSPGDDEPRLFVLASMDEGADPAEVAQRYMASAEFKEDLEGFDASKISRVDSVILDPSTGSPLQ
ncbi:MAG TPA: NIPSNAP family protein [Streptomyces sp.]